MLLVCGQVSAGEAEDTDGSDTEIDPSDGDVGDVDEGVAGGVPGVGEDADDDDDDDDVVDPETTQFVDKHIVNDGFLARRSWPFTRASFQRPGDGYWRDDHRIQSFRTSTADGLKIAQPRPAPEYISSNPHCSKVPKQRFTEQVTLYRRCKKMAISSKGEIFRATDEEIEDALREDGRTPLGMTAEFYVKVVSEARRRHQIS